MRRGLVLSALVVLTAGCASAVGGPADDGDFAPPPTTVAQTTTTAEVGTALTITPGVCRSYAPDVQEDEVPYDHEGAPITTYDAGPTGLGCAHYEDGWAYDGLGWVMPDMKEQG